MATRYFCDGCGAEMMAPACRLARTLDGLRVEATARGVGPGQATSPSTCEACILRVLNEGRPA